jgi:CBS domain containing-hemolysin-like protein
MTGLYLFLVAVLILLTAFFVAAEFAMVKVRPSRIDQLVLEGDKRAIDVQKVISNLDGYLSACQLGITITALGLGWLGEPTVERLLHPVFSYFHIPEQLNVVLSFIIAFASITFLHVVLGELAPKTVAIQKADVISLMTARPLIWFYRIMYPFIWLLNGSAALLIRLFGFKTANEHEEAHSEEELRIILSESYQSGEINQAEYGYVSRIFDFDELLAREIMVPRTDMICLYQDKPLEDNLTIIKDEQYTRFPVAFDNKDNIVGMINTKEFFMKYCDDPNVDLNQILRPVLSVSGATPIKTLLKEMQKQRVHFAVLTDEYGGTSGLVTIEDILEEIVGEIRDEFDEEEKPEIEKLNDHKVIVDGKVLISQINDLLNVSLENDEFDTVGGWLYGHNPLLKQGDSWSYGNMTFTVKNRDKHRIRKVQVEKN